MIRGNGWGFAIVVVGGFIWYIPIWVFGLVILVVNTILVFTS